MAHFVFTPLYGLDLGAFVVSFIFAFTYNKIYIKGLLEKGYKPTEEFAEVVVNYVNA